MPKRVIGIIGVDNLQNIERAMSDQELGAIIDSYRKDSRNTVKSFVEGMVVSETDPQLKEWIISDMSAVLILMTF